MVAVDPSVDTAQYNFMAQLEDDSGRTSDNTVFPGLKVVHVIDVTPSKAVISEVDGMEVCSGDQVVTSDKYIKVVWKADVNDGGQVLYQYKAAADASWITWDSEAGAASGNKVFPPESVILSDGDYNLRCVYTDDDLNVHLWPHSEK